MAALENIFEAELLQIFIVQIFTELVQNAFSVAYAIVFLKQSCFHAAAICVFGMTFRLDVLSIHEVFSFIFVFLLFGKPNILLQSIANCYISCSCIGSDFNVRKLCFYHILPLIRNVTKTVSN